MAIFIFLLCIYIYCFISCSFHNLFHLKQKPRSASMMVNKIQSTLRCHSTSMWTSVPLTNLYQNNMEQCSFSDLMMLLQAVHRVFFNRAQLYSLQQVAARPEVYHHTFALNHCHYTSNTCNCVSNSSSAD